MLLFSFLSKTQKQREGLAVVDPGGSAADSGVLGVLPVALTSLSGLLLIHTGQLPQLWLSGVLNCYFLLTNQTDGQRESRG